MLMNKNGQQLQLISEESLRLIEANDMVIFEDQWKFFQLISILLYQTYEFDNDIQEKCRCYFKQNFKELDFRTISEYLLNPQASQFESVYNLNLQLISQIFQVKVELYYFDEGLMCTIFNQRYRRTIRIFRENTNYFELQTTRYRKRFKFIRKVVVQLVNNLLQVSPSTKAIKRANSIGQSQHLHPTLDVISKFNELSVKSASKILEKEKIQQKKVLTPQLKQQNDLKGNITYGPITPLPAAPVKKRAFDYSLESQIKATEQIIEEAEETRFLKDIMKAGQSQQQQQQQQQIISSQPERVKARLKFFHEQKQYGFFINDETQQQYFVHLDDMQKSGIDPIIYTRLKQKYQIFCSFQVILYQGKQQQNVKAIDIKIESIDPPKK